MRTTCGLVVLLAVAWPATAHARIWQLVATRDIGVDVAVGGDGRAFLIAGRGSVGVRSAAPGARFGAWRELELAAGDRAVDAAVAADGGGAIVVRERGRRDRRVRVARFSARGRVAAPQVVSRGERADFAAFAMARNGAAVVVWFRHRARARWRLEASVRDRGRRRFGPPRPVSAWVRRPCCTSVSAAIGERGDTVVVWRSTLRPAVWAALRRPHRRGFAAPTRLAGESSDPPKAVVGAGGAAAVIYSVQRVPPRAADGLQLHRAASAGGFGAAEHVNPGGGVTLGAAAVTPRGRMLVAWVDRGARVHVSEAGPAEPLVTTADLGARAAAEPLVVAAGDDGRAVVAWSEVVSTDPAYLERATAAIRPAHSASFGLNAPLGRASRAAAPRLALAVPGGGALVVWARAGVDAAAVRRTVLAVTRLP